MEVLQTVGALFTSSGLASMTWQQGVMILVAFVLLYLAIVKKYEPLMLLPISFGMLLTNLPISGLYHPELWNAAEGISYSDVLHHGGLIDIFYIGVKTGIYPTLMFLAIGAMTDFGPMIANPSSMLLGAAAQLGVFTCFFGANLLGFTPQEAASIGIIGGADGPTAIFVTTKLAPHLLPAIAVAAYSYMALIPIIQPPIMRLLTTQKEREIKMVQLRKVSQTEKIIFPIMVATLAILFLPDTASLLGMLMLGNLFKESGVVDRLSDTAQNNLCNIITILLGLSVAAGLGNIDGVDCLPETDTPTGAFARLTEASMGKDTTIGHWEIAGVVSPNPLPTYPEGFPQEVLDA
ncbi:MAG: sodium ion-translocating decarboxylase subunit beta, partial [Clostridia bacterium]|nr:sodium ion-translocating decarboxylase subunit beta [Clostridia bacterium]